MGHVCPWWAAPFTLDIFVRRWIHDPERSRWMLRSAGDDSDRSRLWLGVVYDSDVTIPPILLTAHGVCRIH